MDFGKFQAEVHKNAEEKGWWDTPRSALECHMLMVSELAEATEEARKGTESFYIEKDKPEGELVELADVVIRVMDYCESKGWDLEGAMRMKHEYNKTRSHRHGGKKF